MVEPYDPRWLEQFDAERPLLEAALAPWLDGGIHHVGSTAVPGLAAKPIVDMLAGVRDLDAARAAFGPLGELGYTYREHRPDAHALAKPGFHLHLTVVGSDLWRERLAFRDALRADPALAAEYAAWKQTHWAVDGYAADKRPLVVRALARRGIDVRPDGERLTSAALSERRR